MLRNSTKKSLKNQSTTPTSRPTTQIKSQRRQLTNRTSSSTRNKRSQLKSTSKSIHNNQKRKFFLSSLFGASKDQRVVYEPLNSFNPITLRSTVVPVSYKFPSYILPSIDIVSVSSRQLVNPNYADTCYIIDKTPKLLQLPSISAVTNDSKFVQVFAEATICVTNSLRFSLLGDNYVQALQALVETSVGNVISYVSEKDTLDKQYEGFLVTNIHEDLQRLCDDVGIDVLKLVIMPSQLDLTNVAAQLQLLQTMNDLSLAISATNNSNNQDDDVQEQQQQQHMNPLLQLVENSKSLKNGENGGDQLNFTQKQAADLVNIVGKMMNTNAQQHINVLEETIAQSKTDSILDETTPNTTSSSSSTPTKSSTTTQQSTQENVKTSSTEPTKVSEKH